MRATLWPKNVFRNKSSCLKSLLDFCARVIDTYNTDNTKAVGLIYLEFEKAFAKVLDGKLLSKVIAHGIQGNAAQWLLKDSAKGFALTKLVVIGHQWHQVSHKSMFWAHCYSSSTSMT